MIAAYPASASVRPGERIVLHVATDQPRFRVQFFRWGDGLIPMLLTGWLNGEYAAEGGAGEDWGWPAYPFDVPEDWPSAVYLAHLRLPDAAPFSLAQTEAAALFVVRGNALSGLLYKLPLATYHAYNISGGGCFYANQPRSEDPPGARVSFRRPGGGIGGATWGAPDHYDPDSPRQTFAHWDARFIRWLVRNGYTPEFCTDLDIHADHALCQRYRLLLSVGHDEYWSEAMRDHVETFVAGGGNVAFFSANLCWWRVHLVDHGRAMVCHQGGKQGARDHWWPGTGAGRPEDSLGGVSYRHGGGWWDGARAGAGYRVQQADHWVFAGTGLQRGEAFGADSWPPLAGYECDGVPLSQFDANTGVAQVSPHAGETGTPPGFVLLAAALLTDQWQELPAREGRGAGEGIHVAAMGIFSRTEADSTVDAATATRLQQEAVFDSTDTAEAFKHQVPTDAAPSDLTATDTKALQGPVSADAALSNLTAKGALQGQVSTGAALRDLTAKEALQSQVSARATLSDLTATDAEPLQGPVSAGAVPIDRAATDGRPMQVRDWTGAAANGTIPPRDSYLADSDFKDTLATASTSPRGTVFTAGTTDWAQVLDRGHDKHVTTITRNVIDRLLAGSAGA